MMTVLTGSNKFCQSYTNKKLTIEDSDRNAAELCLRKCITEICSKAENLRSTTTQRIERINSLIKDANKNVKVSGIEVKPNIIDNSKTKL